MEKPKYPKALAAYTMTMESDILIERQIIHNETDEAEFKRVYTVGHNIIKEEKLTREEINNIYLYNKDNGVCSPRYSKDFPTE